jgi:hypothetical protein
MTYIKKCTHSNLTIVCQYKTYKFVNGKAVRECHCKGRCPAEGGKRVCVRL